MSYWLLIFETDIISIYEPTKSTNSWFFYFFKVILMKILIFLFFILFSCQEHQNAESIIKEYNDMAEHYEKIEYQIIRIDTFSKNSSWNKRGKVLIEKRKTDTLFGMSFFANSYEIDNEYLYDNNKCFEIFIKEQNYTIEHGFYGFMGSPGGQLVSDVFFGLDSIYKTVKLIDTKKDYQLQYEFEDDTLYNITHIRKTVIIDKQSFLPQKVVVTSIRNDENTSQIFKFDTILLNNEVTNSIENYKNQLQYFEPIEVEKPVKTSLIGTKFKVDYLPDLRNNTSISVADKLPALISFWEVWCGPCIKSLPGLKSIQNTYKQKINVIGISSESTENAKTMLLSKKIDFLNLKGNRELLNEYEINSFPTYFIVDKNGVIIKEYSFFSNKIEEDIKAL